MEAVTGRRALALTLAIVAALITGCSPLRIVFPLSGQVLDADTRAPISGAVVHLVRGMCCGLMHCGASNLPPVEVKTGGDGHFRFPGGILKFPCPGGSNSDVLSVLAPGYQVRTFFGGYLDGGHDWIGSGPVLLEPVRYATDVEFLLDPELSDGGLLRDRGPLWSETVTALRAAPWRALTPPGVFQSVPAATFDQIGVVEMSRSDRERRASTVMARDRRTGSIHAWSRAGQPVDLGLRETAAQALVGVDPMLVRPLVASGGRIYTPEGVRVTADGRGLTFEKWHVFSNTVREIIGANNGSAAVLTLDADRRAIVVYEAPLGDRILARVPLGEVFGADTVTLDCVTWNVWPVLVGHGPAGPVVVRLLMGSGGKFTLDVKRLVARFPSGEVTACASNSFAMVIAVRGGGIHRFDLSGSDVQSIRALQGRPPLVRSREPLPTTFVGLALTAELGHEVVYAVADDSAVYRFSARGLPDQRVELPPAR